MIKLPINQVKANPNNPRIIKDDKFKKLVQSIKEFPEMLELRPIVVNDDMVVLGGNMRLKACKEAGLDKVPVIKASNLTEEQQKEFIIKDNVGFGEWDWNDLANNWETEKLQEWGLDIPGFEVVEEKEPDDLSDKIKSEFRIEVICKDEKEQELTYNKFIGEGYECRLLTL
jgi:ParB-like chromosome segregation protein Spo0J